jgi:hypothetical protein
MCIFCHATRDGGEGKPSWRTVVEQDWPARTCEEETAARLSSHAWFSLPGMSLFSVSLDVLHVLDQGVATHLAGSILKDIIFTDLKSLPRPQALAQIWTSIHEHLYPALGVTSRLNNLTLSMIVGDPKSPHKQYPSLHAHAAETRHLIPVLAELLNDYNNRSEHHKRRQAACVALAAWYQLVDEAPMFLSPSQVQKSRSLMNTFMQHYSWLHERAKERGDTMYHIVQKFHFAIHLACSVSRGNPRFTWTYQAEDWVGRMASLALSTAHGTSLVDLTVGVVRRYRMLMHLRITLPKHSD